MYTTEAISALLFIVPGLITSTTLDMLKVRHNRNTFTHFVEALIFSLPIYVSYALLCEPGNIAMVSFSTSNEFILNTNSALSLTSLGLLLGLILGFINRFDFHMKVARWLRLTNRTSRESVWTDVFLDQRTFITVNFADGNRMYGWPEYYSDTENNPCIYLKDPCWIIDVSESNTEQDVSESNTEQDVSDSNIKKIEGMYLPLGIVGILITPEMKIDSIEFI